MAALVIALGLGGSAARGQIAPPTQPQEIDLDDVVVTSGTYAEALSELTAANAELDNATQLIESGELTIPDLEVALDRIGSAIPRLRSQLAAAHDVGRTAQHDLEALVAIGYATGASTPGPLSHFDDSASYRDAARLQTLLGAAQQHRRHTVAAARVVQDDAALQLEAAQTGVGQIRTLLDRLG